MLCIVGICFLFSKMNRKQSEFFKVDESTERLGPSLYRLFILSKWLYDCIVWVSTLVHPVILPRYTVNERALYFQLYFFYLPFSFVNTSCRRTVSHFFSPSGSCSDPHI